MVVRLQPPAALPVVLVQTAAVLFPLLADQLVRVLVAVGPLVGPLVAEEV